MSIRNLAPHYLALGCSQARPSDYLRLPDGEQKAHTGHNVSLVLTQSKAPIQGRKCNLLASAVFRGTASQ